MSKINISIILIITIFLLPFGAYANQPTVPPRGKITGLKKGNAAPYSGVLLDETAAAYLLTQKKFSDSQWKLKLDYELAKQSAQLNLQIESQKVSYKYLQEKHDTLIKIKNEEIKRLSKITSKSNNYSTLWATGGIVAGIALTISVVYALKAGDI
jgi:hypothetical protein